MQKFLFFKNEIHNYSFELSKKVIIYMVLESLFTHYTDITLSFCSWINKHLLFFKIEKKDYDIESFHI